MTGELRLIASWQGIGWLEEPRDESFDGLMTRREEPFIRNWFIRAGMPWDYFYADLLWLSEQTWLLRYEWGGTGESIGASTELILPENQVYIVGPNNAEKTYPAGNASSFTLIAT